MSTFTLNDGSIVTKLQIDHWNKRLQYLTTPQEIIQWAILTFPNIFQITAFGLTGLATIDIISKLTGDISQEKDNKDIVPCVFIDTLHNFPQTLDLLAKINTKYFIPKGTKINVFKPLGCETEKEFDAKYGDMLCETDDLKYDFVAKVEPLQRAYKSLNIGAVFTGRRRSQGGERKQLSFVELDEETKILKINPFLLWSFEEVQNYIIENHIPYNELVDLGYKSIGDYHSTQPVASGEDERSGRWKGQAKSECGIHKSKEYTKFIQTTNVN
ncbi:hypothetical protein TBLA_0F02980 [Henningerozyma blattae CBS 6284]|uniref:Phosphoadenosine phosphosulphate reductase domain-containing protein n=1 Tax=Henningerozyma blattae (strain ATCC 34711 / CBS 6284 / DSM 70876 / NBRC 10599 / NRRL Y-10934 / UCD 77-7) TaxID=1071380 RepID=I2H635_HENB6|nr:hypothetical protein TBLA_0F02980 [Tetrapisispora blattae CBS 6284]CCH61837.1 hypothetical protein TBLA_0F02980 [Tetrapisispora blattae CBS 6284]